MTLLKDMVKPLFMGLIFSGFGYQTRDSFASLPFVMGIGFIVFAVVVYVRNKTLFSSNKNA